MFRPLARLFRGSRSLFNKKDYYEILGVPRNASDADIKKAYIKLAKQYHPDVNKAANARDKFAEINSAYETLGNKEKRRVYDSTGMSGDQQENIRQQQEQGENYDFGYNPFGGGGGFSSTVNFEDFMSGFEELFGMGKKTKAAYKGEDINLAVEIPFMDSIHGVARTISFERKSQCGTCRGTKVKPGSTPTKCTQCGGRGKIFYQNGPFNVQVACTKCRGMGTIIKNYCTTCKGAGSVYTTVTEKINIPPGIMTGTKLRMASKGHYSDTEGPPGDLKISIVVQEHPKFKRVGNDIYTEARLSVVQAVLGCIVDVETLQGTVELKVDPGTNTGDRKRLSNYGVRYEGTQGHHYVTFLVQIPKHLTETQKYLYMQLAKEEGSQIKDENGFFNKFKTYYSKP